eukprot:scaffold28512_cov20-Tisochrysis_lutea.AAC.1
MCQRRRYLLGQAGGRPAEAKMGWGVQDYACPDCHGMMHKCVHNFMHLFATNSTVTTALILGKDTLKGRGKAVPRACTDLIHEWHAQFKA